MSARLAAPSSSAGVGVTVASSRQADLPIGRRFANPPHKACPHASCYPQKVRGIVLGATLLLASLSLSSQDLKEFEKKVTEFTLPNGLHFLVVERHEAPVVSFHTYVNAGSADDATGETGLAHLFEHVAFKGTESIGTRDWPAEKRAL